jgi:cobalt-zinc-cadmium efflux system outer membrane protein
VAAADRITANTLPNPQISYGGLRLVSGLSTGAINQDQLVVDQPLLLFRQRQSRRDLADLNVAAEQANVAAKLADRRLEVRQAFAELVARQEELRILEESRGELQRIEQIVRGRASAGDRSQYDVLRIETEGRTLDVELMNASTDVEDASGHLAALLGFPGWRPSADGRLDPGTTPIDLDVLWDTAQHKLPSLVAAERQQSVARGGLLVAERERLPVPSLSGGVLFTREDTGTSIFFGASVPLPIFDRNRGAIARATAEVDAETRAANADLAEAHAEVERARAVFVSRRQTLATVESDLVQRVPTLRRMAEDAYREGQGSILELLDASRSLKDIQLLHIKQLEMTKLAEEAVISAAGLDAQAP